MSTETMERPVAAAPVVALTPPQRAAVALNTAEYEIKLRELLTNSVAILAVTNKAGRDECHTAYMVLKNTRCAITNLSEGATEDAKAFTKAVKAEAIRLIAITTAEEDRLEGLRDGWDEAEKARKAALIAQELARTEAIQAAIQAIRDIPLAMIGKSAQDISRCIAGLVGTVPDEFYQEFIEQAKVARHEVLDRLAAAETAQRGIEIEAESQRQEAARVAAEAEELRLAEAARQEAERIANAAQRAENERVANENAIAAKRLADQEATQALVAKQLAEKAAANLKAEQDALAEQVRLQREAAAEAQAKLDAQQAQIAADRKAFEDEQAAAVQRELDRVAAEILRQQIPVDHAEGLEMNAALDAAIARIEPVEKFASDDLTRCNATVASLLADNLPPPESCCARDARINEGFDETPTDGEILDVYVENFGGTREQAIERLALFDAVAARAELVPA